MFCARKWLGASASLRWHSLTLCSLSRSHAVSYWACPAPAPVRRATTMRSKETFCFKNFTVMGLRWCWPGLIKRAVLCLILAARSAAAAADWIISSRSRTHRLHSLRTPTLSRERQKATRERAHRFAIKDCHRGLPACDSPRPPIYLPSAPLSLSVGTFYFAKKYTSAKYVWFRETYKMLSTSWKRSMKMGLF